MKNIEQIKQELYAFGIKYRACERRLKAIKGNNLTELFANIADHMYGCKENEFNSIFGNDLVIEDGVLLCNCINDKTIKIPTTVHTIGDYAFAYCRGLTSIEIPNSVTKIGDYAFGYCKRLTSILIPDSVTSIGDFAFADCWELKSVTILNSATSIGDDAFYNCNPNLKIIRK